MDDQSLTQLHRTQKAGFVLLSLFAVCVLVLGAYQFRTTIYGPFAIAPAQTDTDLAAIENLFEDEGTRLQRIDTDQDGINDFEELNFYNTSPYIADTDSDGIPDKQEIDNGTNPTCPSAADCNIFNGGEDNTEVDESVGSSALLTGSVDTTETLFDAIASATAITEGIDGETAPVPATAEQPTNFSDLPADVQETVAALAQNPEAIRELLRQSGSLSDEQIDAFSDELLIETAITLLTE